LPTQERLPTSIYLSAHEANSSFAVHDAHAYTFLPSEPCILLHHYLRLANSSNGSEILTHPASLLVIVVTPQQAVTLSTPLLSDLFRGRSNAMMAVRTLARLSPVLGYQRAESGLAAGEEGDEMDEPVQVSDCALERVRA
jgi:hypothetical protein